MPAAWYRLTAAPNRRPRRLPLHPVRVPDRVKCLDLRCALPQALVLRALRPGGAAAGSAIPEVPRGGR
jgi:hypothetical protein